jgi:transposase InsO family protein
MFIKHKEKVGIRQLKMLIERDSGPIMNRKKIARIKRKFKLVTNIRKKSKFRLFHKKNQEHKTFPNFLERNFIQSQPDKVYSIDITQINYGTKKMYVAAVKDLCTKEIVGKSISNRIDIKLTNSAIDKALKRLTTEEKQGLMVHSDQGFHFTHFSYREKLKKNGVTQSMSRKGNCIDNALFNAVFVRCKFMCF